MRIGSARPSSALLGAREPGDKTDAGLPGTTNCCCEHAFQRRLFGRPTWSPPGPRRLSPTGRPGRAPGGLGADHGTARPAEVRGTVVWQRLATQRQEFGLPPYHVTAMQTLR